MDVGRGACVVGAGVYLEVVGSGLGWACPPPPPPLNDHDI